MSTVDKMLIKGIRSFDPENKNVITFFKPLTLIVGPNGAGKTTIIECLKLSCTGELPPNARSGHSFIHDPKVSGETETKGQIKLRFKTAAGKDVVSIRSFQLTQKASKMEYKAIESVLQTINPHTGEKVCLSYRCADMDREISALMGVSKAILENVIFVHQDEANWPLQDPSTLKKKFDDIFSATRYTKALEVIKKLHKDQNQEIKTYRLKLENLQTLKDAAFKLRESISHDQEKTESMKIQIEDLQTSVQAVDDKIHDTEVTLKELRKLQEQISTKTAIRETLYEDQQNKYAALKEEIEDTDEELEEWKSKFAQRISLLDSKISRLEREMKDTDTDIPIQRKTISDCIREISRLEAEAEAHILLKKERDTAIQNLFKKQNLGYLPNSPFSNEDAVNLTNKLNSRAKNLENDLDDKKKSNEIRINTARDRYEDSKAHCKNIEVELRAKAEAKNDRLKRIENKENELGDFELEKSKFRVSNIDEKEKNMSAAVEKKLKQLNERAFDSNIEQKKTERYSIDHKIKNLDKEKDDMAGESKTRLELSLKREELESQKKKHRKKIDDCKEKIRAVLKGRLPSDKDLKSEITRALSAVTKEFNDLNNKSREGDKEVNNLQMKVQDANSNISKLRKEAESKKRRIESKIESLEKQSLDIDSYLKVLESAKEKRDVQKSKYNIADGMRQMFDPFERVARAHHVCPCCERPFSAEEEDDFVRKQRVKATSSAEHMKVLSVESCNADSYFQQLDKLRTVHEEYRKIVKETIPNAEKELEELTEELDQKTQALDDVLAVLAQVQSEKGSIEAVAEPIGDAHKLFQEIQSLQEYVNGLKSDIDVRGQGVKSLEDIQSELKALHDHKDHLDKEVEKLMEENKRMLEDVSDSRARLNLLMVEKEKVANVLRGVEKAKEDLETLAEENNQLDIDIKDLEMELGPLVKEKDKLLIDHNELKAKLESELKEQTELLRSYQRELDPILALSSKINKEDGSKKRETLEELHKKQSESESKLLVCEKRKREILTELSQSKDLKANQGGLQRNIEDNLNYRKTKAEVDQLSREIESLEETVVQIGNKKSAESELSKLCLERDRLLSEVNRCRGTMSVYQSNVAKNKVDLKQAIYKDIDKRYFDQLIQLKTTEMANKDLDRYYNALDKALMRFHTMKMEEINKIIKELWQQTYRGQDIDYISIHSDSEGAGTRSYSYKVVMQTGDAELEMRGRCSAGQKVLASLIIRLALAETFCLNCGILALDEPTTNLDGPNAESLAAALVRIMEDRKGQENFQLIVITHDERFAHLIGRRQHAEKYYRVAKDDYQHSIIEAQEIFD